MKKDMSQSLAALDAGTDARGQQLMLNGVENDVFTAVLDPEKQDDGAWVRSQREKCVAFVKLAASEVEEALRRIEAQERDISRKYGDLSEHRCVGRLRKLAEGGWAISGGDPAARTDKQLFIVGSGSDERGMMPCVTCDAKGGIAPGSNVNGRAGEPVFIEIKSRKKG